MYVDWIHTYKLVDDTTTVITSYSIHYTKLYDLNLITEKADMEFAGILSGTGKMTGRNINRNNFV